MANQVAWVGADGNLWWRQGDQVINAGSANKYEFTDGGLRALDFSTPLGEGAGFAPGVDRIEDPNAPVPVAQGGGGATAPNKVLNQAAIDNTNKALASLDDELNVGYGNIDRDYGKVISGYDVERGNTRKDYEEEGVTNTQNLQRNKQNALVSGAQGLRGLRGVLGSIGALSGDGGVLANRAVTSEVNQDIGGATDTAAGNAKTLDKAWNRFDEEDDRRRKEAADAKINNRTALEGEVISKRQNFFQKLAELYGEVEDTGNATRYLNQAGDLNAELAQKRGRVATPITSKAAAFTPGELENYLAGAQDMTVDVRQGGAAAIGGPNTLLAGGRRESEDERRRKLVAA